MATVDCYNGIFLKALSSQIKLFWHLEFEIFLPKIIGSDFSGTVVKDIGEELKVGDKVTGKYFPISFVKL